MAVAGLRLEHILSMREWAPPIVVCPVSLAAESKGSFDSAVRYDSEDADVIEEEVPAGLGLLLLRPDWHGFRLGFCIVVSVEGRKEREEKR